MATGHANWGFVPHPLLTLPRQESIALLTEIAPSVDVEIAEEISAEVGDLPLALHLAASFPQSLSPSKPGKYLAQLRANTLLTHPSLQGRGMAHSPTDHDLHIGRTFTLSYDQLDDSDETGTRLRSIYWRQSPALRMANQFRKQSCYKQHTQKMI